jgi:hypothetical protein
VGNQPNSQSSAAGFQLKESEWLLRSTIPLRIHNTLLQKPGSQALQVCRSHFPSSGSKSLPTDDANSLLLQKELYRSFKICPQKINSPPPRILGFHCRFPSYYQSPFFPYLSLNHTLSSVQRQRKNTPRKKKKDALPEYGKQPIPTLQSYLESCALPSYPFQEVCCTAHPTDVTTTGTVGKEEQHWSRKAHARQEWSLLRCASLISQAPIHDQ